LEGKEVPGRLIIDEWGELAGEVLCGYLDSEGIAGLGENGRYGLVEGEGKGRRWVWERGGKKGDGGEWTGAERERD
jgi:hypothetical protein